MVEMSGRAGRRTRRTFCEDARERGVDEVGRPRDRLPVRIKQPARGQRSDQVWAREVEESTYERDVQDMNHAEGGRKTR